MDKEIWKPGNMLYPLPVVMVSCARPDEKPNIITVAWAGTVCSSPAMVSISVRPERWSHAIIEETGEFVINLVTQIGLQGSQILFLFLTHNYYMYVLCMPVFTIVNNLWIGFMTKKMYPEARCEGKLEKSVIANIKKLVAGSFIQKACATTRNFGYAQNITLFLMSVWYSSPAR